MGSVKIDQPYTPGSTLPLADASTDPVRGGIRELHTATNGTASRRLISPGAAPAQFPSQHARHQKSFALATGTIW